MKTTVVIPDPLLEDARRIAREERTTLRALVEEGLQRAIQARESRGGFRLRRVTFGGSGMSEELEVAGWSAIRDAAYEGRGG